MLSADLMDVFLLNLLFDTQTQHFGEISVPVPVNEFFSWLQQSFRLLHYLIEWVAEDANHIFFFSFKNGHQAILVAVRVTVSCNKDKAVLVTALVNKVCEEERKTEREH